MMAIRQETDDDISEMRLAATSTYYYGFGQFNAPENMTAYVEEAYHLQTLTFELNEQ